MLESKLKFLGFWIVSSQYGLLVSTVLDPYNFGFSAPLPVFAMISVLLTQYYDNYQLNEKTKLRKYALYLAYAIIMILLCIITFVFPGLGLDRFGHLGSFLSGIPLYYLMFKNFGDDKTGEG